MKELTEYSIEEIALLLKDEEVMSSMRWRFTGNWKKDSFTHKLQQYELEVIQVENLSENPSRFIWPECITRDFGGMHLDERKRLREVVHKKQLLINKALEKKSRINSIE